eukprot:Colp12_sorted_trinity150504_noHs@2197
MKYLSTRAAGKGSRLYSFEDAILTGYTEDGGLLMPYIFPQLTKDVFTRWSKLSYPDLCFEVMSLFISRDEVPREDLRSIIDNCFHGFDNNDICPLVPCTLQGRGTDIYLSELWHGPTLAFKDLPLQVTCALLDYFLQKRNTQATVLVGTSGDTGSAAMHAISAMENAHIIVLYPKGRISKIQQLQMTTFQHERVHVVEVEGTSDDLDVPIKNMFLDPTLTRKTRLVSINSVNIVRILAQIPVFFFSWFQLENKYSKSFVGEDNSLGFTIPSGALGNATAALFAKRMGLPIRHICVATNENDAIHRFFCDGVFMMRGPARATCAPAMDINMPYNLERLLYVMCGHSAQQTQQWMQEIESKGQLIVPGSMLLKLYGLGLTSYVVHDDEIKECIKGLWGKQRMVVCPHTAVGVQAALQNPCNLLYPAVVLATAHPAKFHQTVREASGLSEQALVEYYRAHGQANALSTLALDGKQQRYTSFNRGENWDILLRQLIESLPTYSG